MVQLTVNGVVYNYPELTDEGWGPDATNWALAITQGVLTKAGGLFTLTADADFGPNFGLKSVYYKSRSSNISTVGQVRLSNSDVISFRNAGNTGNLNFGPGSSDAVPQWNGIDLVNLSTAQTLTNKTLVSPIITGSATFVNLSTSGNTTLGDDASVDTLTLNSHIINSMIPASTDVYDIGTSSLRWKDLYINRTLLEDGAVGTPSLTFRQHTTTGIYYSTSASALSITNAGADAVIFTAGGARGLNGGSGSPSWSFINDISSGMYLETTNKIAFATNAVRRMAIANTSIFLDVPTYSLNASAAAPSYSFDNSHDTGMYLVSVGVLGFSAGGQFALKLNSTAISPQLAIQNINGTVSVPSYSFANAQSTGFYLSAANTIGITTAGSLFGQIDSTGLTINNGVIYNTNGTATNPSYTFSSDPDTGLYRVGFNNVGASANGALVWQWDTTGIVLNNNSVIYNTDGSTSIPAYTFNGDTDTGMMRAGSGRIGFVSNGILSIYIHDGTSILKTEGNPLTTTDQYGFRSGFDANSSATSSIAGFISDVSTAASVFTAPFLAQFYANPRTKGAGSTITRTINYFGSNSSEGVSNSWASDNGAFTGNYVFNFTSTRPSLLTGQLQLGNGTLSSPGLVFTNSPNAGIYSPSADRIVITGGGAEIVAFASGRIQAADDGSAFGPSYTWQNDIDTGFYRVGANTIGFTTGGVTAGNVNGTKDWTLGVTGGSSNHNLIGSSTSFTNGTGNFVKHYHIQGATLTDNTALGVAFTYAASGSENIIVEYSLTRATGNKETGTMIITQDGSTAQVAVNSLNIGTTGVIFTADINAGNVRLLYTTTSTGSSALMRYSTRVWAD